MIDSRESEKDSLRRRLHFEEILSDITVRLMGIPFAQVDQEIDTALMQIFPVSDLSRDSIRKCTTGIGFRHLCAIRLNDSSIVLASSGEASWFREHQVTSLTQMS